MMKLISSSLVASCGLCLLLAGAAQAADHTDPIIVLDEGAAAVILIEPLVTTQRLLWAGLPLVAPTDMVVEADGTLLIADPGADAVFSFDWASGIDPVPLITDIPANRGWLLRLNDDEILLSGRGGLIRVNTTTGGQTPLPTVVVDPFDIAFRPDGSIVVADPGAAELITVDPVTFEGTTFSPGTTTCWIDVDPTGQVAAVGPTGVYLVDRQGGDTRFITNGVFLPDPSGVAFGSHGELYVADRGSAAAGQGPGQGPTIVKVDPVTGGQTEVASGGFLQAPSAIVVLVGTTSDLPALPTIGQGALVVVLIGVAFVVARSRWRASVDS